MNTRAPFSRLAASAAVGLLLAAGIAWPAHANHLDFTLFNESGTSIYSLYVTPADSAVWGRDVLGRQTLSNRDSTRITFPGQTPNSPCLWDIKVVYSDRTTAVNRFNLCRSTAVYAR
jgi:hypothetical protein